MVLSEEAIKELIKGKTPDEIVGEGGLLKQLQKQLVEAALKGELTHHLGYEKHEKAGKSNSRNGYSKKTLKGEFGELEIEIPRDRNGEFKPVIVEKGANPIQGFRQENLVLVCPWNDHSGDPSPPVRNLRCGDFSSPCLHSDQ